MHIREEICKSMTSAMILSISISILLISCCN